MSVLVAYFPSSTPAALLPNPHLLHTSNWNLHMSRDIYTLGAGQSQMMVSTRKCLRAILELHDLPL